MHRKVLSAISGTAIAVITLTGTSFAAGRVVKVGTPFETGPPSIAVDNAGNAVIAWADTKDLNGANDFVQYCVLPVNATACVHQGNLIPADGSQFIDGVQVLSDGSTLVIMTDTFGALSPTGVTGSDYEPVQEWQSTDDGATWAIVNAGKAVAAGNPSGDTEPLGGVVVPGSGVLGFGFNTAGGEAPTFHAFALTSPTTCSRTENGCPDGYATLEPPTNPDQVGNAGGNFAAHGGSSLGIMAVFNTDFTNGPLGCSNAKTVPFGTAYAYGTGAQAVSNSYNVSPGQPSSAWRVPVTQADCNVEYPAVGGGPAGFGILETNELTHHTIYHRFDAATERFDTPEVTVSTDTEQQPTVSQDGSGDIFATYLDGGAGGPVSLSYSADGGKTWIGPATLSKNTSTGINDLTSNVNADGQGWTAWDSNGSVFAKSFTSADSLVAATVEHKATTNDKLVKVKAACSAVPCTLKLKLTKRVLASASHLRSAKHKTITVGHGTFPLKSRGKKTLAISLTKAGRHYLSGHHGKVLLRLAISEKALGTTIASKRTIFVKAPKK